MQADLLVMGHGSRDPDGAREFCSLLERLRLALPGRRVEGGVLEFAGPVAPSIQEAVERLAAAGATAVAAQPVLLFNAGHNKEDMPAHQRLMTRRFPHIRFARGVPFGFHTALREIVRERALAAAGAGGADALLLVARGTHHPEANGDMMKLARLVWEEQRARFPLVEAAFVSLAEPYVPEGIRRCVALGARRVVVVPYFVHTGILVKRIREQALATAAEFPGVHVAVAEHLGTDPRLVAALLDHVRRLDAALRRRRGAG